MHSSRKTKSSPSETPGLLSPIAPSPSHPPCGTPYERSPVAGNVILLPMKAHVWVMPKRTVLDPQGQTIQHALSGLGYASIKDVRQGKFFVLNVEGLSREEALKQLERISKEVLTNPVIEESRFEIVE